MALKPVLATKADVDALPEALRGLYVEKDGKFLLDVDDITAHPTVAAINTKLGEFRNNNTGLLTKVAELDALKARIEKFKDVDPDEYRRLKTQFDALPKPKGDDKTADLAAIIKAQVEAALAPVKAQLETEKTERTKAQRLADTATMRETLGALGTKKKMRAGALDFLMPQAEGVFQVVDGKLKARDGHYSPDNAGEALSPEEWLANLARQHDWLFEPTEGGKTPPRPGAPRAGVKSITREEMSLPGNLEKVAKGELIVQ